MRNLTREEIQDLESRGIKPGILLKCPLAVVNEERFSFSSYDSVGVNSIGDIRLVEPFILWQHKVYAWLKVGGEYAMPVEQPQIDNTVRPVFDGLVQPNYGPSFSQNIKEIPSGAPQPQVDTITMHGPQYRSSIDWEARRWELATKLYIHYPEVDKAGAIESADDFIREYKNTQQP